MNDTDLKAKRADRKSLLVIRNGMGIVAEADDIEGLQAAYEKVVDEHRSQQPDEHLPKVRQSLPSFGTIRECHQESVTGTLCILKTDVLPHAAADYYLAGFVS